jgi:hypothetical protein
MKKFSVRLKSILIVFILFIPMFLMAGGPPMDDDVLDNEVPFDGGLTLLIAAGIGYGLKKVHDKRKEEKM